MASRPTNSCLNNDDAPLALSELRERLSAETYEWLKEEEAKEIAWRAEQEEEEDLMAGALFFSKHNEEDESNGEEEDDYRVQEWISSSINPDGYGGIEIEVDSEQNKSEIEEDGRSNNFYDVDVDVGVDVRVKFILSDSGKGHGDVVWAASRHISNLFADPIKCSKLIKPEVPPAPTTDPHPLFGKRFLELGAGAAIPSWTALWCGAHVLSTDQAIPDRIRCMAECAERNLREIRKQQQQQQPDKHDPNVLHFAKHVKVCPYDWGSSIESILECATAEENIRTTITSQKTQQKQQCTSTPSDELFDVIVAADCCYMPEYHPMLLESIHRLLHPSRGVALLPFALHSNTADERVWGILDAARDFGFRVEVLEAQQLTPQASHMDSKRALVHTVRLTHHNQE